MNAKQLEILAVEIATGGVVKRTADQLVCIVRLIFYGGFKKAEIIDLVVRDVIDSKDKITQWIDDLKIIISGNSEDALRKYLKSPKDRRPHLLKRDAPLFPGYRNTKKLDRDLKDVDVDYMDLIHSGLRHAYHELLDQGFDYMLASSKVAKKFRHEIRTVQNIVAGKTVPAGARDDVYTRVVELFEKASNLKPDEEGALKKAKKIICEVGLSEKASDPIPKKKSALEEANEIICELEITHQKAQDGQWKDELEGIIRSTREKLEPIFSAKQKTDAERSDNEEPKFQAPDLLKLIRSINSNSTKKDSFDLDDENQEK